MRSTLEIDTETYKNGKKKSFSPSFYDKLVLTAIAGNHSRLWVAIQLVSHA